MACERQGGRPTATAVRTVSRGPVQTYSAILIIEGVSAKHGRSGARRGGAAPPVGGVAGAATASPAGTALGATAASGVVG